MPLTFQSLRSSSAGNCVMLRSETTAVLIDCGIKTQRDCDALIDRHVGPLRALDGVLVSHAHGDHVCYASLRTLARRGVPIHSHRHVLRHLRGAFGPEEWPAPPQLNEFPHGAFTVGDFEIEPMEVPHDPHTPTYGFVIRYDDGGRRRKVVVCTDFCNYAGVLNHFVDADFIFVEANHDLDLLRRHPNYASRFHMSNPKTAWLLYHAVHASAQPPQGVMLGHLSNERNRKELALAAVQDVFARENRDIQFDLRTAPLYEPSEEIRIG